MENHVKKCPACGEIIPAMSGVCPSCGHVVKVRSADNQELLHYIQKMHDALAKYKGRPAEDKYKAEVENVIREAKVLFGKDPTARKLIEEIESEKDKTAKKYIKFVIWLFVSLFGLIFLFALIGIIADHFNI